MVQFIGPWHRSVDNGSTAPAQALEQYTDRVAAAFAVTRGKGHVLVYANAAFRELAGPAAGSVLGRPVAEVFGERDVSGLTPLLDRAYLGGAVCRNRRIGSPDDRNLPLMCTAWPDVDVDGRPEQVVIELRPASPSELTVALQREVAERLLVSALREKDAAEHAEESRRGAAFLASESRRLTESLDEGETLWAMERMSLPHLGAWCIVDTLDDDDMMHRLAIVHPDPAAQLRLAELEGRWVPDMNDGYGLAAVLRSSSPQNGAVATDGLLANAALPPTVLAVVRSLGVGPLLTVPLIIAGRLLGAVTFVARPNAKAYTREDIELAEDLAARSAIALDRARLYGEAVALKLVAESASEAKSIFLGMMSHELRTPLNAIGGYVDLIDMELHGPVTEAQHSALARIRTNQRHLMKLITDLLNLTRMGNGRLSYDVADVDAREVIAASVSLVEPLFAQKGISYDGFRCEPDSVVRADRDKVIQIIVNLLSNAIKFTPSGGRVEIECERAPASVLLRVCDNGIGVPTDQLDVIFDQFVQVSSAHAAVDGGVGLGLAISRSLARAMQGDLTVSSTLGRGSRFTLTLPRAGG